MARRKSRGLGVVRIESPDRERVQELKESAGAKQTARAVKKAACEIIRDGEGFGSRKAFFSDIAKRLGRKMDRTFAGLLVGLQQAGYLSLQRADLRSFMDQKKLEASEVLVNDNAEYHFVDVDCDRDLSGARSRSRRRRRRR